MKCRYVINKSPKAACPALSPFQMSDQIVKFNSLKLITARKILCQHNINAITTYNKYLIRQFNLTLEWDVVLQLATLGQETLKFFIIKHFSRGLVLK